MRKRTAAEPAHGRVETPAPCIISGQHLRRGACARAVHMNADIVPTVVAHHRSHDATDQIRRSDADRIRERDRADSEAGDVPRSLQHFLLVPRIAVWIAECH